MTETMKTYRLVAETPDGGCCIDVVLRGQPKAVDRLVYGVSRFLDFDWGFAGAWVDRGTVRERHTVQPA